MASQRHRELHGIGRIVVVVLFMGILLGVTGMTWGAAGDSSETNTQDTAPPRLPLPFHAVEGVGGSFSVHSAYMPNPPAEGDIFGKPSIGGFYVHIGQGRHLTALTFTETINTPIGQMELGYALDHFDSGDLRSDIFDATGLRIGNDTVNLHNFNLRLRLLQEGACDQKWLPQITTGVHYKYNAELNSLDRDTGGTLTSIGIDDNHGIDYTLYASKMVVPTIFDRPVPIIATVGGRLTKAAHIGLLGFTDDEKIVFEGALCAMPIENVVFAVEYRQKPDEYAPVPGLIESEDDWWTVCAAYLINERSSIAAGYGDFGNVLNHAAHNVWGVSFKYEL